MLLLRTNLFLISVCLVSCGATDRAPDPLQQGGGKAEERITSWKGQIWDLKETKASIFLIPRCPGELAFNAMIFPDSQKYTCDTLWPREPTQILLLTVGVSGNNDGWPELRTYQVKQPSPPPDGDSKNPGDGEAFGMVVESVWGVLQTVKGISLDGGSLSLSGSVDAPILKASYDLIDANQKRFTATDQVAPICTPLPACP